VINPAEPPGKGKPEKSGGQGDLEGSEKVFPHHGTDEKGDQAKRDPQDKIDSPETWRVKKMFPQYLQHEDNVEKKQGWSTQEKIPG